MPGPERISTRWRRTAYRLDTAADGPHHPLAYPSSRNVVTECEGVCEDPPGHRSVVCDFAGAARRMVAAACGESGIRECGPRDGHCAPLRCA